MKTKNLPAVLLITFASLAGFTFLIQPFARAEVSQPTPPILSIVEAQYENNFSDDKILVGGFHNVFVGKVIAQTGTRYQRSEMNAGLEKMGISPIFL